MKAKAPIPVAEPTAALREGARLPDHLKRADSRASRQAALAEVMGAWGATLEPKHYLEAVDDDPTFFNLSAKAAGFLVQRIEGDLAFLRRLNMPAILEFRSSGKQPHSYLGLTAVDGAKFLLKTGAGDRAIESDAGELGQSWNGVAYLPWKNFLSLSGTIPGNAPADSVLALKMLLRDLGYTGIPLSKDYDGTTQKTVEQIQAKYGVPVDGVVGNLTKIILYREGNQLRHPPARFKLSHLWTDFVSSILKALKKIETTGVSEEPSGQQVPSGLQAMFAPQLGARWYTRRGVLWLLGAMFLAAGAAAYYGWSNGSPPSQTAGVAREVRSPLPPGQTTPPPAKPIPAPPPAPAPRPTEGVDGPAAAAGQPKAAPPVQAPPPSSRIRPRDGGGPTGSETRPPSAQGAHRPGPRAGSPPGARPIPRGQPEPSGGIQTQSDGDRLDRRSRTATGCRQRAHRQGGGIRRRLQRHADPQG